MSAQDLHTRLAAAEARAERAAARLDDARKSLCREQRRIALITAHIQAGPGHVFTPDPDPNDQWAKLPHCRLCSTHITALNAAKPCPGDRHACPAAVAEGATITAFRLYGHDGWVCGQPGRFLRGFRAWVCAAEHRTEHRHSRCLDQCPCRFLALPTTSWRWP